MAKELDFKYKCTKCGTRSATTHQCFVCKSTDNFVLSKIKKKKKKSSGGVTIKISV